MKKLLLLVLTCLSTSALAESKITPPDVELGLWVTKTDTSALVEQALKQVPAEMHDMMRGMIEKQMEASSNVEQCFTQELLESFDEQMKKSLANQPKCNLDIIESTSKKLVAETNCDGNLIKITTDVINSKQIDTKIEGNFTGQGEAVIKSTAKWQSSSCK